MLWHPVDLSKSLLHRDRFGEVSREIHVQTFCHREPVGNQLKRNDVEKTLQNINGLGYDDLLSLVLVEFWVIGVTDDDRAARASNDCMPISIASCASNIMLTLLIRIQRFGKNVVTGQNHDDGQILIDQGQDTMLEFTRHDSFAVQIRNLLDLQRA